MVTLSWLREFVFDSDRNLLATYGDLAWNLAQVQTWMNSGPILSDSHLAFPLGFDPWKHPQLGLANGVLSWLAGQFTTNVSLVFSLTIIFGALLDTVFLYLLFDYLSKNRFVAFFGSIYFGAGIFTLGLLGHSQVRIYYIIYASLYFLIRSYDIKRFEWVALILMAFMAPLWMLSLNFVFLVSIWIFRMFKMKEFWQMRRAQNILLSMVPGLIFQLFLYIRAEESDMPAVRYAWDSNIYGGRLVDFFLSSPFLNNKIAHLSALRPGGSLEPNASGLFAGIFCLFALGYILGLFDRFVEELSLPLWKFFKTLTLIFFLFFISGGLGNLTAGFTQLIGFTSPIRTWSRLLVLIAVLGYCAFALLTKQIYLQSRYAQPFLILILLLLPTSQYLDLKNTPREKAEIRKEIPEYSAVSFLQKNLGKNCAVLQLPIDNFPNNRVSQDWADVPLFHYRGFVPYLLDPSLNWTFGYSGIQENPFEATQSAYLEPEKIKEIKARGICAVFFDKLLAQTAINRGIILTGSSGVFGLPNYQDDRFEVFILESD